VPGLVFLASKIHDRIMDTNHDNLGLLVGGVNALTSLLVAEDEEGELQAETAYLAFVDMLNSRPQTAMGQLVRRFSLDEFEVKCLLLALVPHAEPRMASLIAKANSDVFSRNVTVGFALERFCRHTDERIRRRQAFLSSGSLIKHRLVTLGVIDVGMADALLSRRFQLTMPTVRYLMGEEELADDVAKVARLETPSVSLLNVILDADHMRNIQELFEHHTEYRELIEGWGFNKVLPYGKGLTFLFSGPSGTGKTLLAHALAAHAKRQILFLSAADLPEKEGVETTLRDVFTEAAMREAVVLIDECETLFSKGDKRKATAFGALEKFEGITILTTNHPEQLDDALERRIIYHFPFEEPDPAHRRQIWEVHLPPEVPLTSDIDLDILANRYDFTGGTIKNAILVAVNRALAKSRKNPTLSMKMLDDGCLSQLRYALEDLTVRTSTHLRLKDIVLPEDQDKKVREIIAAVRNQAVVLNSWGFGKKLVTGKGITCLFDGPPGTGKTFCAEIIAGEFERPLYRVNIPEVVSKWVGETEKHIKAIFQQARISHAMLLFDEADSLFAARSSETSSATDRYANMEVNLLLQEIERFPGICILTTNFFGSLDKALIRRIQFRVTFEEPDVAQRELIWEKLCPAEAPLDEDVDFGPIAKRFELTGGNIKNALLRAAYWACEAGTSMTQEILKDACIDEYKAAGKLARDPSYIVAVSHAMENVELQEGPHDEVAKGSAQDGALPHQGMDEASD
jgi:SpoVK/Ycf46/Vps4 family AAA+-type ATPase